MLKINQAYDQFLRLAIALYGEREGQSIARLVFEDGLGIRNVRRQDPLSKEDLEKMERILEKLRAGEPVQYALGHAHFYGLTLVVDRRVLIPRPETEELVNWVLEDHLEDLALKVLDIGAGSGCIALALKKNRPGWSITALDASAGALEIARTNAGRLGLALEWLQMDILDEQNWAKLPAFDLIVSNPPYIPRREARLMSGRVLRFEPGEALFVDDDRPLIFYEKIAALGLQKLTGRGKIYVETNEYNAADVAGGFQQAGYHEVVLHQDMQGKNRMVRSRL